MDATTGLTASLIDTATALADQRLRSQLSIRTLHKALEVEGRMAIALIQSIPAADTLSSSPAGRLVDVVA